MIQQKTALPPVRPRTAAHATQRRHVRARRARYMSSLRVLGVLALLVFPVMVYVMLTSNVTGLNYAIAHAQSERLQLQQDVQRLDDRVAHLQSRERLALVAAKLGMRDSERYEIVTLPEPPPKQKPTGIAFLGWFKAP